MADKPTPKFEVRFGIIQWIQSMIPTLCEFIETLPEYDGRQIESNSLETWIEQGKQAWIQTIEPFLEDLSKEKAELLHDLLEELMAAVAKYQETTVSQNQESSMTHEERQQNLDALISRPQHQQRTENWYTEGNQILTASQFSTILKEGRTRGLLVLEKAGAIEKGPRSSILCCKAEDSSPFDWGIRFEPVVKQIYCDLTKTTVGELGRIRHPTDSKLAASPDGVVLSDSSTPSRFGRFVEFKAPVTRPLLKKVPDDYYVQMQIQMECGSVDLCDYLEVKFTSQYGSQSVEIDKNATYKGLIYLIINSETEEYLRYEYSPLNTLDWAPTLKAEEHESIYQVIPWSTSQWWLTTVRRSPEWFESVKPLMERFWADVERAKRGEFVLPESKRKPKVVACQILDDINENNSADIS